MDPQMVWDALDECEEDTLKTKKASQSAKAADLEHDRPTPKETSSSAFGFFGFPFSGCSKK